MNALAPAASALYDSINAAGSPDILDNIARAVWHHWGKGEFGDEEATFLTAAIDKRRPLGRRHSSAPGAVTMKAVGRHAGRQGSRFTPRQRPRSPDRQASRERRRRLGGSSALPDTLRHHYTEGQRAVLCIIAGEVKHHGICDLPVDKIGALAGVCRTTVQTTLHEARRLGHISITERPQPGRKHLSNLVEITSAEWNTWIKRAPSAHRPIGSNSVKMASTTKNINTDDTAADARARISSSCAGGKASWKPSGTGATPGPTPQAETLATELAQIAGYESNSVPRSWQQASPPHVVQNWLDQLEPIAGCFPYPPAQLIRKFAQHVKRRAPDRINSPRYFEPEIMRLVESVQRPHELPKITIPPRPPEVIRIRAR